ncbi:bifunctional nuclease 2 isoform X3 [Malania oleifera]|nr:bifunctional nuclease 2 isoform X3 [Malania oleifera]
MRHYRMRRQGFEEEMKWQSSSELLPFSVRAKESRVDVNSLGLGFLRRFQSPTIFLKISCDGDFLLPIIVGELAVEKLIDTLGEDEYGNWDCPNQFQLVRDLVGKLGYEVRMVKITERVANTYFSRIYFSKPGEKDILSLDARPSDAINVATRCKAPIYVNKQIVSTDAIRIVYGLGSAHGRKAIYDVSLDSATDDPDLLAEELDLVRNMNLSVEEERYHDAAMWRERLNKLRKSRDEQ